MKKMICLAFMLIACHVCGQEADSWFEHWLKGMSFFQEKEYQAAIIEYSESIHLLGEQMDIEHLYLHNDRGQAYVLSKRYDEAILDFTKILETENVAIAQTIRALWGRTTCYATLEDSENFKLDYERLKATDPDYPKVEYTKEYIIFRNFDGSSLSSCARNKFCCAMIHLDFCKSKEDIIFTNTGVCLVKRRCQCGCEKSLKELADEEENGKSCNCCGEIIYQDLIHGGRGNNNRSGNCKYWCDRVAQASFVLCGSTFNTIPCKMMCTAVVEALKEGCHWCCEGDGFYKKCVKPFEDFISQVPCDPQFG